MAVKDCNELSNIIAIWVAAGDDDLAQEISRLSLRKRDALARSWNLKEGEDAADTLTWWTAHELELKAASADIELRAIVQAKILNWDIRVWEAYMELANQIKLTWGTIAWWVDLLEKVRNAAPADYEKIAKLRWGWYSDWATAMKEIQESISEFVSSNYSISEYSRFTNDKAAQLRKQLVKWELTQEKYDEEILKLHKEAMDAIAKWENPSGFVKLDKERQTIKKVFWKDPEKAGRMRSQFIMARELLTDGWLDDDMLKAFSSFKADELTWELTLDQIAKCNDLDKLLARAYTNTEQLYRDWVLRQAYRERLINLSSWWKISKENIDKVNSLSKTLRFTEQWASFSDVLVRDKIYRSAKKRWLDVSKTDWTKLYNGLLNFSKEMEINPDAIKETIEIAWVEMKPIDVVQLLYDVTWDDNILQLIKIWSFDDKTILDVATRAMLWENKVAAEKIIKLFTKAKETPNITNARDLALKTITWENIKEGASVGFFDYKKWLYNKDDLNRMRADFMDKLAEKNKMKINGGEIKELTTTEWSAEDLAKVLKEQIWWWYLIVNDVKRKDNDLLREALDIANSWVKEENKIIVINPHRAMDANFTFENWDLYFRTMDDLLYKDVAWTISIQSLWEARPTREIEATLYEATTWRNWDKIRYQASYTKWWVDNAGRNLSDQQVDFFAPSKMRDQNWNMVRAFRWRWDPTPSEAFGRSKRWYWSQYWDQTVLYFSSSEKMWKVYGNWGRRATGKKIRTLEDAREEINARAMNEFYFRVDEPSPWEFTITMKERFPGGKHEKWDVIFRWNIEELDRYIIDEDNAITMFPEDRVYEAYLYAENPLIVDAKWKNWQSIEFNWKSTTTDNIALYAAQNWYDWVIIRNVVERSNVGPIDDYIVFNQSQVKGIDNLVPTTDVNRRYQRWEWWTNVMWWFSLRAFLNNATDEEVWHMFSDYVYNSLDASHIWDIVDRKTLYPNLEKFNKLSFEKKREVINRLWTRETLREIQDALDWIEWKSWRNRVDRLVLDWNDTLNLLQKEAWYHRWVGKIMDWDVSLRRFTNQFTNSGFLPFEAGIYVDANNDVLWTVMWTYLYNARSASFEKDMLDKWLNKFFHNHPNWWFFSDADISAFKELNKEWVEIWWLILPWWVRLEFPIDEDSIKVIEKYKNDRLYQWWRTVSSLYEDAIWNAYKIANELWIVDKQERWVFADAIRAANLTRK